MNKIPIFRVFSSCACSGAALPGDGRRRQGAAMCSRDVTTGTCFRDRAPTSGDPSRATLQRVIALVDAKVLLHFDSASMTMLCAVGATGAVPAPSNRPG